MSEFMICDLLITIKKGNKFLYIFFLLQTQNRGERLLSFVLMFFVFFLEEKIVLYNHKYLKK